MALFQFKSKGVTRKLVDLVYPVGSLYFSTNSTNPSTLFGGTWQPYAQGRTIIGAGQGNDGSTSMSFTSGQEVGEYNHLLTIDEMPTHWHGQCVTTNSGNGGAARADYQSDSNNGDLYPQGVNTYSQGGSKKHNNIQPSIVCNIYRRIA